LQLVAWGLKLAAYISVSLGLRRISEGSSELGAWSLRLAAFLLSIGEWDFLIGPGFLGREPWRWHQPLLFLKNHIINYNPEPSLTKYIKLKM